MVYSGSECSCGVVGIVGSSCWLVLLVHVRGEGQPTRSSLFVSCCHSGPQRRSNWSCSSCLLWLWLLLVLLIGSEKVVVVDVHYIYWL